MYLIDWLLRLILPITSVAVIATMIVVGQTTEPNNLQVGFAPEQPILFSHKVHAGDNKIDCQYCHVGAETSRYAAVPPVETCMNCHRVTKPGTDQVRELTRIFEEGEALKWKRIHKLPDHVYFDHRPHVNSGINCRVCHGPVETFELQEQFMSVRMGNCLQCHRDVHGFIEDPKFLAPLDKNLVGAEHCGACHR